MGKMKNLYSAQELAETLGVSRATVSRLIKSNKIGVYRICGRTLFDEEMIRTYLKKTQIQPDNGTREEKQ